MKLSWSCEIPKNFWTKMPSFYVFRLFLLYLWTNLPTRIQLENERKEERKKRDVDRVREKKIVPNFFFLILEKSESKVFVPKSSKLVSKKCGCVCTRFFFQKTVLKSSSSYSKKYSSCKYRFRSCKWFSGSCRIQFCVYNLHNRYDFRFWLYSPALY